jgi:hypothetical protein
LAEVIRDKEEGRHLEELAAGGGKTKKGAKVGGNHFAFFLFDHQAISSK